MTDHVIETIDTPRIARPRTYSGARARRAVRVYKDTPETVCVQIRALTGYASVSLTAVEAADFARAILAETDLVLNQQ